jgi:hypothetical protein
VSQDVYAYWRACLGAGAKRPAEAVDLMLPTIGAAIAGENPQAGLWKVGLAKGKPRVLMQVWLADANGHVATTWRTGLTVFGVLVPDAQRSLPQTVEEITDRWLFVTPASKDEALHFRREGRWPADPAPIPSTHNLPNDPFEACRVTAEERLAQAERWLRENTPVKDQAGADAAMNLQRELVAVHKQADVLHDAEKEPVLRKGREIAARYRFRDTLTEWEAKLRSAAQAWMVAEERRQREEAARKFAEDQAKAEAERARLETERAQKVADDPVAALTDPPLELPELPLAPEPVAVQAGGGVGKKASLRTDWTIEFTDYRAAAAHVCEQPEISILVGKVIQRLVRAARGRIEIPGVKITEVRKAA